MKCGACGYEKREEIYYAEEVVRFKTGKRKGEVKEVKQIEIEPGKDDPAFIELTTAKKVDPVGYYDEDWRDEFCEVGIFACPKCGTLKIDV